MTTNAISENYPLRSSDRERRRLTMQAESLTPFTEKMFSGACIGPGSRVLEIGCGGGDLTLLLADRVGAGGEVIALDRHPKQVDAAASRIAAAGFRNVQFITHDMDQFEPGRTFDAVVGRYFLLYVADPELVIARAAKWVRNGGYMAFLEMDFFRGVHSSIWPPAGPETNKAIKFIGDVMLDAGINPYLAARLPSMLTRYGKVHAETSAPLQFGANSIELPLEAVRSVIPMARKLGRADAEDYDVDKLLASELVGRDDRTVTVPPLAVAAWVRIET